jgi:peroxiredoxin Q/BCP
MTLTWMNGAAVALLGAVACGGAERGPAGASPAAQAAAEPVPLAAGTPAPAFSAPASDGTTVELAALRGRPVVLYFYPRDATPG